MWSEVLFLWSLRGSSNITTFHCSSSSFTLFFPVVMFVALVLFWTFWLVSSTFWSCMCACVETFWHQGFLRWPKRLLFWPRCKQIEGQMLKLSCHRVHHCSCWQFDLDADKRPCFPGATGPRKNEWDSFDSKATFSIGQVPKRDLGVKMPSGLCVQIWTPAKWRHGRDAVRCDVVWRRHVWFWARSILRAAKRIRFWREHAQCPGNKFLQLFSLYSPDTLLIAFVPCMFFVDSAFRVPCLQFVAHFKPAYGCFLVEFWNTLFVAALVLLISCSFYLHEARVCDVMTTMRSCSYLLCLFLRYGHNL